eukprot:TRINITY_DN4471_c0_g1_i1.p1 TRINITY_DN4471_c0_g1~~TRINITY_DN4471_c0_g1_i1.p1  ORF type:complete len:510 (+),score=160.58 TRINITY_DN4471_c0_g1_i1:176-1531(+)
MAESGEQKVPKDVEDHKGGKDKKGAKDIPAKKPKTKAERRALQEAQRAAKAAAQGQKMPAVSQQRPKGGKSRGHEAVVSSALGSKATARSQLNLFSHLDQYEKGSSLSLSIGVTSDIHPAVHRLGLKYANGSIVGSNARAVALMHALKHVIQDYKTPPQKSLDRDLEISIRPLIAFLKRCRPIAIGMGNAINYLKYHITRTAEKSEVEAKAYLCEQIDTFLAGRVHAADKLIADQGASKINDGDVVLTFACSHVVKMVLNAAYEEGKKFRVVVVDSRPRNEGVRMLADLVEIGMECTYVAYHAVSYIMKEVTKVFLGASALLANGAVVSRNGTAGVAMMASSRNLPVLVCCETYKFCDRAQLDSICFNELGNPAELLPRAGERSSAACPAESIEYVAGFADKPTLNVLNLTYDLTPIQFVTAVLTDVGIIPPTSVPVVLREYNRELPMSVS